MNKNYLFAGFVVIMMMATVAVPFMASEESDALSGNANMALSSDRAILYLQGQKGHSATFTASLTDTPYYSQGDIYWRLNNLGDGGDVVSFSDTTFVSTVQGTDTVTVYGNNLGSIELEAYVNGDELHHHASAVIVVLNSPSTTATEFHFWFQVYNDAQTQYYVQTYGNSAVNSSSPHNWTSGFWVTVTAEDVADDHPTWEFNAGTALAYAVENEAGWAINFDQYGWISNFMGLGSYGHDIYEGGQYVSTTWYYWAQYHCTVGSGTWAFNDRALEFIDTEDHAYIGLVFWGSPSANALTALPTSLPTA